MSRTTLMTLLSLVFLLAGTGPGLAQSSRPHLDPSLMPVGCPGCHSGHGVSRSPMLPAPEVGVCLTCHGSQLDLFQQVGRGRVSSHARPDLLADVLAQSFVHPLDRTAVSRDSADRVTCTSCHSPHRGRFEDRIDDGPAGRPYLSPRNFNQLEFELCEGCHGSRGAATQSLTDISRLFSPENRSYHPVEAPSATNSPSVIPELAGREINCTDCHGNSDPKGPRGPHGSKIAYILRAEYTATDGGGESPSSYALCYGCHDRKHLLNNSAFPQHGQHITEYSASCSTCHNPHGSVKNRALIRFGEETSVAGVSPSLSAGWLGFISEGPGSGACFLNCHGSDHGPLVYGMKTPGFLEKSKLERKDRLGEAVTPAPRPAVRK